MEKPIHIALLIESTGSYGRGLLRGIGQFIRAHRRWSTHLPIRNISDEIPQWLNRTSMDGVILRTDNRKVIQRIRQMKLPVVALYWSSDLADMPLVTSDETSLAQMAFGHFKARGFKHFAYCGLPGAQFSDQRREAFVSLLARKGISCHTYQPKAGKMEPTLAAAQSSAMMDENDIGHWLKSLPKPVALLACNDIRGRQILNACRQFEWAVPDEIAVIGVDNDQEQCELADPSLTSIIHNTEKMGYEAAVMLHGLIKGEPIKEMILAFPPTGICSRQSTEGLAIQDAQVAKALHFMRNQIDTGINVQDVLNHVHLSRSTLERRFVDLLGRTPKEEIQRLRLNHVKQLLKETDFTLETIAELTGFSHPEYLPRIFKKNFGMTPTQYRHTG